MLPGPEKALDDAKTELGKLEANCFGKVRRQVAVMTAAQSLLKPLKPGIERKTLCSTCVQSLADYDLGLPAKMAALLQTKGGRALLNAWAATCASRCFCSLCIVFVPGLLPGRGTPSGMREQSTMDPGYEEMASETSRQLPAKICRHLPG
jgi:hypothetical protein